MVYFTNKMLYIQARQYTSPKYLCILSKEENSILPIAILQEMDQQTIRMPIDNLIWSLISKLARPLSWSIPNKNKKREEKISFCSDRLK